MNETEEVITRITKEESEAINRKKDIVYKASITERASHKHAVNLCRSLNKIANLKKIEEYLNKVVAKKNAVAFTIYNSGIGHKKKMGPGRYPKKVTLLVKKVIENLKANLKNLARTEKYEEKSIFIKATLGRFLRKRFPRAFGRADMRKDYTIAIEAKII